MTSGLFLIADDFGLGRGHDAVILRLLAKNRLAGTSVMIDGGITPPDLEALRELRSKGRQVGLHLNLTHTFSVETPRPTIDTLLRELMRHRVRPELSAEFYRQADRFVSLFGRPPDFYDGHQHCHCLPGLSREVTKLPRLDETWIRAPLPRGWGIVRNVQTGGLKTLIVCALAWQAKRIWKCEGVAVNWDFSGFLRLKNPNRIKHDLSVLVSSAPPGSLMMVHPGDENDPEQCCEHSSFARLAEAEFLEARSEPKCVFVVLE